MNVLFIKRSSRRQLITGISLWGKVLTISWLSVIAKDVQISMNLVVIDIFNTSRLYLDRFTSQVFLLWLFTTNTAASGGATHSTQTGLRHPS